MNFIQFAEKEDWEAELRSTPLQLPDAVLKRHPNLPTQWLEFIAQFDTCTNLEGSVWFLCQDDFEIEDDTLFSWDFIEKICLKQEGSEKEETVRAFWDDVLPIFFAIGDTSQYVAIQPSSGAVVLGKEPDFMNVRTIAPDFPSFLQDFISKKITFS